MVKSQHAETITSPKDLQLKRGVGLRMMRGLVDLEQTLYLSFENGVRMSYDKHASVRGHTSSPGVFWTHSSLV